MALKDPKIGPLKMINCSDSMKLRSTQKIKSLGILSWGVTHTCRENGTLLSMRPSQAITGEVLVSHEPQRQVNLSVNWHKTVMITFNLLQKQQTYRTEITEVLVYHI